jgi:hypothetical protein
MKQSKKLSGPLWDNLYIRIVQHGCEMARGLAKEYRKANFAGFKKTVAKHKDTAARPRFLSYGACHSKMLHAQLRHILF